MATKDIPTQENSFHDADLDRALALHEELPRRRRQRVIASLARAWRNRHFLFRCAGTGLLASVLAAFIIPPRYTSTARLMPPEQGAGSGMAAVLASVMGKETSEMGMGSFAGDMLGLKTTSDLFLGVLKSRTIKDSLINKFDLRKVYWDRRWEDARKDLEKRTDLSSDRKSGIITIMVEDRNRQRAAAMAAEYVAQLDRVVTRLSNTSAHKERVFLEQRLTQVTQDLEKSEQDFSQFASKNTAIDIKEQGRAMLDAAGRTEGELIAAETELQGLRQLYTDNNVRVRASEARIQELRRQLQKLGGSANPPGNSTSENADQNYPRIRQLPALGVPYADLYRRVKVQETIFEVLTKQFEMAKIQEAKETLTVKVLDAPEIPEKKSFPPRILIVACGTLLSIAFGLFWISANERWQHADHADPGKILGQEVLDSVRKAVDKLRKKYLPNEDLRNGDQ